mgnify:CR=1 FL=1
MMYAGSIFTATDAPPSGLRLPRLCWQWYDALDGQKSAQAIATALGMSADDLAYAIRTLRQHGLIEETVETYVSFRTAQADAEASETASEAEALRAVLDAAPQGDGAPQPRVLHMPSLWTWLKEHADNVKAYKNLRAFILMEAGEALATAGAHNEADIDSVVRVTTPSVVEALERAVERNADAAIPDHCYHSS